ncbi:MAG: protein kinase, partial [Acidobacteria bacterium]|nr:protein kinase [Acidobacteriota bacterium]
MSLTPGTRLGPYEVLAPLGAGGMGEVYKARDTRLDRTVALKVLPSHIAADPVLRQRLEREARTISSLDHPHICALYDVGHQNGIDFLVMQYLEGETLADALARGPLPVGLTLNYGIAIADALDRAHRQGIVHRDLKPSNVMLTKSGVKLLDFGLAKLVDTDGRADLAAPTRSAPLTEQGTILGTLHYMSPEQLEGKWISERPLQPEVQTPAAPRRTGRIMRGVFSAVTLLVLAVTVPPALVHLRETPAPARVSRFTIATPDIASGTQVYSGATLAVSPDGLQVVFVSRGGEAPRLWLRPLDTLSARMLGGTEGAEYPFWSPDSRAIGFFANGKLKTLELSGGQVHVLADAANPHGGSWGLAGEIIFAPNSSSGLFRISEGGGDIRPATILDSANAMRSHRWPVFLPGGRHFAFLGMDPARVFVASLDSPAVTELLRANSSVIYSAGHLLFMRGNTLFAQPFDPRHVQLTGAAFPLVEQVSYDPTALRADYSASEGGVLAYIPGKFSNTQLVWFDRTGKRLRPISTPAVYLNLAISPDERTVATARIDEAGSRDVWLVDLRRDVTSRLTLDPAFDWLPIWSPDGTRIAFTSDRDGPYNLYQKASNGTGSEEPVFKSSGVKYFMDWSADGRFILFDLVDPRTNYDIWALPVTAEPRPIAIVASPFNDSNGRFAPIGSWIAYASDESGRSEVYVRDFRTPGHRWQISNGGGFQ